MNFSKPLSAAAQQAREIRPSYKKNDSVCILFSATYLLRLTFINQSAGDV